MPYMFQVGGAIKPMRFDPPMEDRYRARMTFGDITDPVELAQYPPRMIVGAASPSKIPDIMGYSTGPFTVVPRLAEHLDRLEPNTHRFLPIEVLTEGEAKRNASGRTYMTILAPPIIDAVHIEATSYVDGFGRAGYDAGNKQHIAWMDPSHKVSLKKSAVTGKHLWRLPKEYSHEYMCSDELRDFIKSERLRGLSFLKKCQVSADV